MTDTEKIGGKEVAAPKTAAKTAKGSAVAKKAAVKKSATPTVPTTIPPGGIVRETLIVVSDDERYRMIAEAAYYRAENCQFQSDPVSDWIEAEKEIAALLGDDSSSDHEQD